MKQKQRKITTTQVRALEKKLIALEHRRCNIAAQTTPLKVTLRKYIQQNMATIEYCLDAHKVQVRYDDHGDIHGRLRWAVSKIKRGYFGDANLKNLIAIVQELREADL